ncbi:MAG: FIVAR domain-containing protein [Clostridiales bacterium]|nr:FIVAR domain-containing protein [Clostridiales bacterium]
MSKTKRIISFLLAAVMVFSITSVGVNAKYAGYKDGSVTNYDAVDKPILTTEQYASMALDEVDRILAKENVIIPIKYEGLIDYTLDFSSIDKAFDSIKGVWGVASSVVSMMGDIQNLNVSAVAGDGAPRRAGATSTDLDVIKALVKFLKDNSGIIKKAAVKKGAPGALSLGLLDGFVDFDLDIPNMIKGIVYKLAYDQKAPKVVNETMDQMVQVIIDKYLVGELDPDTGEYTGFLPELAGAVNIETSTFYDLLDKAFRLLFNDRVNKLLDTNVRSWVKRCVRDDPSLGLLINTDYVVPTIDFNTWGNGETIFDHFNDVLGDFFMALAKPSLGLTWDYTRGNDGLFDNLVHAAKKVFGETGGAFFLDYIEVIDPATFPDTAEGDEQFLAYVARSLINAFMDYINVPDDMDTLVEVANYTLRELAGDYIPSQYSVYADMDLTDLDTAFEIGADFAIYFLSQTIDLELDYEDNIYEFDFDETLNAIVNWGVKYYGGLVASSSGTGWARLNSIFFQVFNSSWLPNKANGSARNDLESIIKDDIIGNLFNLDLKGILDLFQKNPTGELNQTVRYILISLFKNIINMVFGSGTAIQYDNFEAMISGNSINDNLPNLVQNIINNLYTRCTGTLLPALLPIVCSALDLSSPQEFAYPYISLGDSIKPTNTRFYIYNESSGINTFATYSDFETHQDQLYKYRIKSITTNQSGLSVKYNNNAVTNININGGESAYFDITGTFTPNSLLIITIKYDILGEYGSAITTSSIEQKLYTYVAGGTSDDDLLDDDDIIVNNDVLLDNKNVHKGSYYKVTYINSYVSEDDKNPTATRNKKIRDLLDVEFSISRRKSPDEETFSEDATITRSNVLLNATLAASGVSAANFTTINTNMNGGKWNIAPYAVSNTATLPADGVYASTFSYLCGATYYKGATETIPFDHYVVIYNNANLPSLVSSAVKANRQASNYDTSSKVYSYEVVNEDGETETMTTTGSQAWADYTDALEAAITKVYAPMRYTSFYTPSYITDYTTLSENLKNATIALEACVKTGSGGTGALKDKVEEVVPTNIDYSVDPEIDPETGEEKYTYYKFYDDEYEFFSMCDYVPHTYLRFRNEKKAAEKLINSKDTVDAVKLSYVSYRFGIYADRLIRVVANNDALLAAVDEYGGLTEQGNYSQTSWDRYTIARDFANTVAAIPLDEDDLGNGWLTEDGYVSGLRQSKVNKARGELILAYKMLVENADYTSLNNAIANAASVLLSNKDKYTTASWTAFENALNAANSLSRNLAKTVDNQNLIERLATALNNAVLGLTLKATYTALTNIIAQAQTYTDSSRYTEDSWAAFTAALMAALNVNPDLAASQQQIINTAVQNLSQAISNLVYLAKAGIEAIVGATDMGTTLNILDVEAVQSFFGDFGMLLDPDSIDFGYIFGFDYYYPTIDGMIEPTGGATIVAVENENGNFGTGARVEVYDGDELVMTYYTVLFGDADCSGGIDDADKTEIVDAVGYSKDWADGSVLPGDNPRYLSCDVNFDGAVDDIDPVVFDDYSFAIEDQSFNYPG